MTNDPRLVMVMNVARELALAVGEKIKMRTFTVVGVSRTREDQPYKLRVANGKPKVRQKIMESLGHVDIMLVPVDPPVTKEQALNWLKTNYPDLAAQLKTRPAAKATCSHDFVRIKYGTYLNEPVENVLFPLVKDYTEGTKSGFVTVDATGILEGRSTIRVRVKKGDFEYLSASQVSGDMNDDATENEPEGDNNEVPETSDTIEITDSELSPAAKMALRRVREASRKREAQDETAVDTSEVA